MKKTAVCFALLVAGCSAKVEPKVEVPVPKVEAGAPVVVSEPPKTEAPVAATVDVVKAPAAPDAPKEATIPDR